MLSPAPKAGLRAYLIGGACFLAAWVVHGVARDWLQTHYPFITYFFAIVAAAYWAGLGPCLLVAAACMAAALLDYAPAGIYGLRSASPPLGALTATVLSLACAFVILSLRTALTRLDAERQRYADLADGRDLLYRELQHRVSNNIQVVAGLLRLQARGASPAVKRALTEAASRIGLIAKIQHDLHDAGGKPTAFRAFAEDLLRSALLAAGADHVRLLVEGGDEPLHPEQATAVSLVMLECFNNALEHGYGADRGGQVLVALTRHDDLWRLTVRDDGPGPPADLEQGSSLGLRIVRAMAAQLQGEFTIAHAHPGALCQLTYPALGD